MILIHFHRFKPAINFLKGRLDIWGDKMGTAKGPLWRKQLQTKNC